MKTYDHSGSFIVDASRTRPVHSGRAKCKIRTRLRVLIRAVAVGAYVARLQTDLVDSVHHDMVGVFLAGAVDIGHIGVEAHDGRGISGCIEWKQADLSCRNQRAVTAGCACLCVFLSSFSDDFNMPSVRQRRHKHTFPFPIQDTQSNIYPRSSVSSASRSPCYLPLPVSAAMVVASRAASARTIARVFRASRGLARGMSCAHFGNPPSSRRRAWTSVSAD